MSYNTQNPYHQGPSAESAHGNPYNNNGNSYGHQNDQEYELRPYPDVTARDHQPPTQGPKPLTQPAFLAEVTSTTTDLSTLQSTTQTITQLHAQILRSTDPSTSSSSSTQSPDAQLQHALWSARYLSNSLRERIRTLERDAARTPSSPATESTGFGGPALKEMKTRQASRLKEDFRTKLNEFQGAEARYRRDYHDQVRRQFLVVRPDAREDEIEEAVERAGEEGGVFQSALMSSRRGQATAVLSSVRARHASILRIEKAMQELAEIMQDLDAVIQEQEYVVADIEQNTEQAVDNLAKADVELDKTKKAFVEHEEEQVDLLLDHGCHYHRADSRYCAGFGG